MDGKREGLWITFIIERFWRTLKWEYVYLKSGRKMGKSWQKGLKEYLYYYNNNEPIKV